MFLLGAAVGFAQQEGLVCAAFPSALRPGEPVTVALSAARAREAPSALLASLYDADGKRLSRAPFFEVMRSGGRPVLVALLAVPSLAEPGSASVRAEDESGTLYAEALLSIAKRAFAAEEIPLNPDNTALRTEPDAEKTAQTEYLSRILYTSGTEIYTTGPFTPPLAADTFRTSFFGDRRVYVYSNGSRDTAVHAGIDYRAASGTKVHACARGRVALARYRISTGYSVVLEHLPGVYSLYYHLSSIAVEEGELLESGELIGLSGSSGLATGPHLHWEIRVAGENADPDALVSRPLINWAELDLIP